MKRIIAITIIATLGFCFSFSTNSFAQASCDPCPGVSWSTPITTTFTFSLPSKPGCVIEAHVKYRTRTCMGKTQVDILPRPLFVDITGAPCSYSCFDVPALEKAVYNHIFGLLPSGASIIKVEEAPCYYLAKVDLPPAAISCYGVDPNMTMYVNMPCDDNGCCYSELTPTANGYDQHVINATPCPPNPTPPAGTTMEWSCDNLGGGTSTFTVTVTPVLPLICQNTCFNGPAKPGRTTAVKDIAPNKLKHLKLYPNPVTDVVNIQFTAKEAMDMNITLFDISGKVISTQKVKTQIGEQTFNIDMRTLPSGVYGVTLKYSDETITTKVTK